MKKNLLLNLIIISLVVISPVAVQAQQRVSENFIFVNYIGQEIILDLDDVTYIIPGTNATPEGGRLVLQLPAGQHKYAAQVPGVPIGSAGEFTIAPGGFVAKAARLIKTDAAVDHNGIVLAKPKDRVDVFDFDPFASPAKGTPILDTWQPAAATPGLGSLVWINYNGDELTIDLAGTLYKVPPLANDIPGRLQINIPPGHYRYTVSVPYGSLNSEITVVTGQVTALNISAEVPPPPRFEIGEPSPLPQPISLRLFQEDLTLLTSTASPDSAPVTLPETGGEITPTVMKSVSTPDGLLIKNYTGDRLVFTINHKTYMIDNNTERTLSLPPGRYSYTASLPFVATGGVVDLVANPNLELSIVINIEGDFLTAYEN